MATWQQMPDCGLALTTSTNLTPLPDGSGIFITETPPGGTSTGQIYFSSTDTWGMVYTLPDVSGVSSQWVTLSVSAIVSGKILLLGLSGSVFRCRQIDVASGTVTDYPHDVSELAATVISGGTASSQSAAVWLTGIPNWFGLVYFCSDNSNVVVFFSIASGLPVGFITSPILPLTNQAVAFAIDTSSVSVLVGGFYEITTSGYTGNWGDGSSLFSPSMFGSAGTQAVTFLGDGSSTPIPYVGFGSLVPSTMDTFRSTLAAAVRNATVINYCGYSGYSDVSGDGTPYTVTYQPFDLSGETLGTVISAPAPESGIPLGFPVAGDAAYAMFENGHVYKLLAGSPPPAATIGPRTAIIA